MKKMLILWLLCGIAITINADDEDYEIRAKKMRIAYDMMIKEKAHVVALLKSKSPQIMYIEAGKQERKGSIDYASQLYEAIIDRFPNSDFAVKASDKLTFAAHAKRDAERAEQEESNRRSQSRQECENNKKACIAGCGGFISGADSHNNNMWQCKNKCEQISCY